MDLETIKDQDHAQLSSWGDEESLELVVRNKMIEHIERLAEFNLLSIVSSKVAKGTIDISNGRLDINISHQNVGLYIDGTKVLTAHLNEFPHLQAWTENVWSKQAKRLFKASEYEYDASYFISEDIDLSLRREMEQEIAELDFLNKLSIKFVFRPYYIFIASIFVMIIIKSLLF
jgi:hypothetical protein